LAPELEALAEDESLDVDFLGLVDTTVAAQVMVDADVLLCLKGGSETEFDRYKSRYAASGKLTEYLASGTPILVSDIPAFSDQIKPFVHLVSPEADDDEMLGALSEIFSDYDAVASRALRGQQFAFSNFSNEVQRRRTIEFIQGVSARGETE
jgi:glycosyltransferase involved in cell wall biosynthesis